MRWRRTVLTSAALLAATAVGAAALPGAGLSANSPAPPARLATVAVPAAGDGDTLAVLYSGDGGWGSLDQGLAKGLAKAGIPVAGVSSLRYFWRARTPQGAADDLAAVLRRHMAAWGRTRVVLVGFSFGADALPAIIPRLPPDLRQRIRLVALVGPGPTGELHFRLLGWLGIDGDGYPRAPAIGALSDLPMLCVYGDRERRPACPTFPPRLIRQVKLPGGHHFDGHYAPVARAILAALPD